MRSPLHEISELYSERRHHDVSDVTPAKPFRDERFYELDVLIEAGWGDVDGWRIPANWRDLPRPLEVFFGRVYAFEKEAA